LAYYNEHTSGLQRKEKHSSYLWTFFKFKPPFASASWRIASLAVKCIGLSKIIQPNTVNRLPPIWLFTC